MKVSKNNVSAAVEATKTGGSKYESASKHIRAAIEALGSVAKDDVLAKESIANLGVVLLDLNK